MPIDTLLDRQESDFVAFAADTALAAQSEIDSFRAKLDTYDEVTVVALMENQENLDVVTAQILALLERGYVMDDSRRVFKTEDGNQVSDEFGQEVSLDDLDFDLIGPERPAWESFVERTEMKHRLNDERQQILKFQKKLDTAREEIADGEISQSDLEDLEARLADAMPPAVSTYVPGCENATNAPSLQSEIATPATQAVDRGQPPQNTVDQPSGPNLST